MTQKIYDQAYEDKLFAYFQENLPEKIYDAHFHLYRKFTAACGYPGEPYEHYSEFMEKYLGRKISGGLVMPQPSRRHKMADVDDENAYNLEVCRKHNLQAGLIITPACGRIKTEAMLEKYPQIRALKPYLTYSVKDDEFESDITDFAPEWMWAIAHERNMPMILHLSHYRNMLSDENNIRELNELCRRYSGVKLILAHCAMGHHVMKLRWGLEQIRGIQNIWFDCSGAAEALSIYYCMEAFGPEKMMYGGDFDHAHTVGRIVSFGSNFLGLHNGYVNEDALYEGYKYEPLNNGQECLLALLQAMELMNLDKKAREDIFYGNAARMFGVEK